MCCYDSVSFTPRPPSAEGDSTPRQVGTKRFLSVLLPLRVSAVNEFPRYLRRPMQALTLVEGPALGLTLRRLCHQLIEDHGDLSGTALIGLQPRGVHFARRLRKELTAIVRGTGPQYGELDITFHRDDFRHRAVTALPGTTELDFSLDGRRVVLVDDVLFTGRSIRAGLDAMLSFGRPSSVQLMVLVDRRFNRELPIQPDYVGKWVDSIDGQHVAVEWKETEGRDRILLLTGDGQEGAQQPQRSTPVDR